jgi:hypothetical protein
MENKMGLTAAQKRYLAAIRAAGPNGKVYNGRGARVLEVLEAAGLIEVDWWTGGYTSRELHCARALPREIA